MTDKLTWAEFVDKYKPKDGDKFFDDRGNEWEFNANVFKNNIAWITVAHTGRILTCPLIPPEKKRKMWPAIIKLQSQNVLAIGGILHESLESAKRYEGYQFHSWPAIPGPDGAYEIDE